MTVLGSKNLLLVLLANLLLLLPSLGSSDDDVETRGPPLRRMIKWSKPMMTRIGMRSKKRDECLHNMPYFLGIVHIINKAHLASRLQMAYVEVNVVVNEGHRRLDTFQLGSAG